MNKQGPRTLYHYTDSAVLVNIIQSRKIRLSARWHLNDPREGEDFLDLLNEYVATKSGAKEKAKNAVTLLHSLHFYVACFSENDDCLSQ